MNGAAKQPAESEAVTQRCAPTILVVDDSPVERMLLRGYLEQAGFRVLEAESGEQALQCFSLSSPDMVLLDIMMPGLSGFETCSLLREMPAGARTPVIMVTTLDDEDSIELAYRAGATDFIIKPTKASLLCNRIRYLLRADRVLTRFDSLTGLPNRSVFLEHLSLLLADAELRSASTGLLFLDLDQFQRFNETLGRRAGDELICQIAERLRRFLRTMRRPGQGSIADRDGVLSTASDLSLARFDGDEFVVALPSIDGTDDVARIASDLCEMLAVPFEIEGEMLHLTVSIGVSASRGRDTDGEALIAQAEKAKDHAKQTGRNGYCTFTPSLDEKSQRRFALERVLRNALLRKLFKIHYQPKLDLRTGAVVGIEALIRLTYPDGSAIPPDEFIPVAEDTGLINEIGYWALQTACEHTSRLQSMGVGPIAVAVNISPNQFRNPQLVSQIDRILRGVKLAPNMLELELTERMLLEDTEASLAMLEQLRALGLRISVDDFGTGYSSLSYLKRFKVNGLKIDKSFVSDFFVDSDDASIVNAIITLGHSLGLKVTAEGVADQNQLAVLRALGCDEVQGFYFSEPLPFDALVQWVLDRSPADRPSDNVTDLTPLTRAG